MRVLATSSAYGVLLMGTLVLSVLGLSCAPSGALSKPVVKDCVLPDDQTGTLSGHWRITPIPIAFKQSDFSTDEMAQMVKAADTWNSFYTQSQGFPLIDYGGDSANPRLSIAAKPSALCSQGIVSATQFIGQVVVYKAVHWPYANLHTAIGLTSFCPIPAKPLNNFFMAIMEINYEDFFVDGKKQPDLQSIFLHELGHLVGLNHSCETKDKTGTPNCNSADLNQDYFNAVLFPVILFDSAGQGEQRRDLQSNDQGRANCLYQGTK